MPKITYQGLVNIAFIWVFEHRILTFGRASFFAPLRASDKLSYRLLRDILCIALFSAKSMKSA